MPPAAFDGKGARFAFVHPTVFFAAIGMALGMVVAAAVFLAHDLQLAYLLGVVAVFTVVVVSIPLLLARIARSRKSGTPFAWWRHGEVEICTGRMRAGTAALLILIAPLVGVTGLAVLCLIALLASRGAI